MLKRLKNKQSNNKISQNIFGMEQAIEERVTELQDYIPNFLQIYDMINKDSKAISILL